MARIVSLELAAVELPFRKTFRHAAAERATSYSLFLKCTTDSGTVGYGESLPREYVTGESRASAYAMLRDEILPRLLELRFDTMQDVERFLHQCDGLTPGWIAGNVPQAAAWCAVDLAMLDAFGKTFGVPALSTEPASLPADFRYSGVLSADKGWRLIKSALKLRAVGLSKVKFKLKVDHTENMRAIRLLRRVFGRNFIGRADTNMMWNVEQALHAMRDMARLGVTSFEQPVAAADMEGLARLVAETGLEVMVDESLTTRASLHRLIEAKACTAVNVRICKCGGLVAALNRSREALAANLTLQLGCQVGESSLLSAAQLRLAQAVQPVAYAEGCFGLFLLREDPVVPLLQFGYGGEPPRLKPGKGLAIEVDETVMSRWTVEKVRIE